jgi:hypothetical protein
MANEIKRMQLIAGLITESEYRESQMDEAKKVNKYFTGKLIDDDGEEYYDLDAKKVASYLKSVIDPKHLRDVNAFMKDEEGWEETMMNGVDNYDLQDYSEEDVEKLATMEMSYWLTSQPDEFPFKELNEDISFEAIDRMEGLANIQALDSLKSSLKTLVSDWVQDGGFDEDDVIDYLAFLVRNSY